MDSKREEKIIREKEREIHQVCDHSYILRKTKGEKKKQNSKEEIAEEEEIYIDFNV